MSDLFFTTKMHLFRLKFKKNLKAQKQLQGPYH